MNNSIKQIYASLEIGEREVSLLVGEFFNTRFNIIKSEKIPCNAISDFKVIDRTELVQCIKTVVKNASDKIGAKVEKVILLIPAFNFKRYPLKVNLTPSGVGISKLDVAKALTNSLRTKIDNDLIVVNSSVIKYTINGISTRRLPENEVCDQLTVDIDLLCADKALTYEYVEIVNECGLEVLDLCLNTYAIAKEAALFEQSLNQNIVLLDIGYSSTFLSILAKGKLINSQVIFEGINSMVDAVYRNYKLPVNNILRLLKYNVDFNKEDKDAVIFAWTKGKENYSMNVSSINSCVKVELENYVEKVISMCKPIIERGNVSFVCTGAGSEMLALIEKLKTDSGCEVKTYYPETIGVRSASQCGIYGTFFVYKDKAAMNNLNVNCLDMLEYDSVVNHQTLDIEGETLTSKIKNLFETYKSREENK